MKFKYRKVPSKHRAQGYADVPLLRVRLWSGQNQVDVTCLIDSGATDCLFDTEIANLLDIDLESGEEREYVGIGNQSIIGYVHTIRLQINGFSEWIDLEAGFIDTDQIPLLGQSGFFDSYEITFKRYRKSVEIKSRTHLRRH